MIRTSVVIVLLTFVCWAARAHDHGRWANADPVIRDWIKSLKNNLGHSCCDTADDAEVDGWAFGPDGYRIKVKGEWLDVPPSALLQVPNLLGYARAWLYYENGKPKVRCFIPGAGG